ncbi:uncharacterized protein V6R79_003656, partial [Siganus canaliculatus]
MDPSEHDHIPATQDTTERHVRPQRARHLPGHLSDFVVGYEPQQPDEPPTDPAHPSLQRANDSRAASVRSKHTSHSSRSRPGESRASSQSSGTSRHSASRPVSKAGPGSHLSSLHSAA